MTSAMTRIMTKTHTKTNTNTNTNTKCLKDPAHVIFLKSRGSRISNMTLAVIKNTKTNTNTKTKLLKDPTSPIFLKMIWLKDIKYDDGGWISDASLKVMHRVIKGTLVHSHQGRVFSRSTRNFYFQRHSRVICSNHRGIPQTFGPWSLCFVHHQKAQPSTTLARSNVMSWKSNAPKNHLFVSTPTAENDTRDDSIDHWVFWMTKIKIIKAQWRYQKRSYFNWWVPHDATPTWPGYQTNPEAGRTAWAR